MNNNISQFYIIYGTKDFIPPKNNDVYINATTINTIDELSKTILDSYKEKAKLKNKVGNEIIFLIPSEKYRQSTEILIKKLKVNGKIQLITPPIKKEINPPKEKTDTEKKVITTPNNSKKSIPTPNTPLTTPQKKEPPPIYKPTDNIYRGTIDSQTYNNFKKNKKNTNVALIIFIISFIFFAISILLLFLV